MGVVLAVSAELLHSVHTPHLHFSQNEVSLVFVTLADLDQD